MPSACANPCCRSLRPLQTRRRCATHTAMSCSSRRRAPLSDKSAHTAARRPARRPPSSLPRPQSRRYVQRPPARSTRPPHSLGLLDLQGTSCPVACTFGVGLRLFTFLTASCLAARLVQQSFQGSVRHAGGRCTPTGGTLPMPPGGENWGLQAIPGLAVTGGVFTSPPYSLHIPRLLPGVNLPEMTLTKDDKPVYSRDSDQVRAARPPPSLAPSPLSALSVSLSLFRSQARLLAPRARRPHDR